MADMLPRRTPALGFKLLLFFILSKMAKREESNAYKAR